MPMAMGAARTSASTDEYNVPQMNGRAPNSPETGSQTSVCQNFQPNSWMERRDWRYSSTPMPATRTMSSSANTPVPARKSSSSGRARQRFIAS